MLGVLPQGELLCVPLLVSLLAAAFKEEGARRGLRQPERLRIRLPAGARSDSRALLPWARGGEPHRAATMIGVNKGATPGRYFRGPVAEKVGRVRTCKLGPRRLEEATAWIERYRQLWDSRFDELDKVVEELKRKETVDGREKRE
jgi:hypothetical protein